MDEFASLASLDPSGGQYVPLAPATVVDSVSIAGKGTYTFTATGADGVPTSGVTAVALNVIAINTTAIGDLRLFPAGTPVPSDSTLNYSANPKMAGFELARPNASGQISIFNGGSSAVTVIARIRGYLQKVPDPVDRRSMTPGESADVGTTTPTLHGVFSDPDGGSGHVDYQVADPATGAVVASRAGATVASGSDSAWAVPAGALAAATTYRWWARGNNGTTVSGWSAYKYFNTQNASLTGEQQRFTFEQRDLNDRLELKANVANGNLLLHATDLRIRGTGIDLALDRYYSSRLVNTSALGKGWTLGGGPRRQAAAGRQQPHLL